MIFDFDMIVFSLFSAVLLSCRGANTYCSNCASPPPTPHCPTVTRVSHPRVTPPIHSFISTQPASHLYPTTFPSQKSPLRSQPKSKCLANISIYLSQTSIHLARTPIHLSQTPIHLDPTPIHLHRSHLARDKSPLFSNNTPT